MRVLISPASKHGGTAEIGRFIARKLRENGLDVDVTQPEDIHDLTPYAGFVMGSALYFGSWLPQAERFVDDHSSGLQRKPTWLFSSGPLGSSKPDEPIDDDRVEHLLAVTGARDHQLFGGRLESDRLSRPERFVARWVGIDDCDHRDWDEIGQWTDAIAATLKAEQPDADPPEGRDHAEPLQSSLAHLKETLERFETDHPELTRAVNDVSYYLSGMGI